MGKHWGNSSSEQAVRARIIAVRCLSGGFCLSLAVLTFGVQGLSGTGSAVYAIAVTGLRRCGTRRPGPGQPARRCRSGPAAGAPASSAFTADALALVAYTRSHGGDSVQGRRARASSMWRPPG